VHGDNGGLTPLGSKGFLLGGLVCLLLSLICQFLVRIGAQLFMEYEILRPKTDVDAYFIGAKPFTQSFQLNSRRFRRLSSLMKLFLFLVAFFFVTGLSLSVMFLYKNLP